MPACVSSMWGFSHSFIVVSNSWLRLLERLKDQACLREIRPLGACSPHVPRTRSSAERAPSVTGFSKKGVAHVIGAIALTVSLLCTQAGHAHSQHLGLRPRLYKPTRRAIRDLAAFAFMGVGARLAALGAGARFLQRGEGNFAVVWSHLVEARLMRPR